MTSFIQLCRKWFAVFHFRAQMSSADRGQGDVIHSIVSQMVRCVGAPIKAQLNLNPPHQPSPALAPPRASGVAGIRVSALRRLRFESISRCWMRSMAKRRRSVRAASQAFSYQVSPWIGYADSPYRAPTTGHRCGQLGILALKNVQPATVGGGGLPCALAGAVFCASR